MNVIHNALIIIINLWDDPAMARAFEFTSSSAVAVVNPKQAANIREQCNLLARRSVGRPLRGLLWRVPFLFVSLAFLSQPAAQGQPGIITTVAGGGPNPPTYGRGTSVNIAPFGPFGIATDAKGNLYMGSDFSNVGLTRLDTFGNVNVISLEPLAKSPVVTPDGYVYFMCNSAPLVQPVCRLPLDGSTFSSTVVFDPAQANITQKYKPAAADAAGNVYLTDPDNYRILKLTPNGIVSAFVGSNVAGKDWDGAPTVNAKLAPDTMAVDAQGNFLVADELSVKKVTPAGQITLFAGTKQQTGVSTGDGGPALAATFTQIRGIAADQSGNVYVTDATRVRKITAAGIISTIAGTGEQNFSGDGGPATAATFYTPAGIAVDTSGNVFVADTEYSRVRKIAGPVPPPQGPVFDLVANAASAAASATKGAWISIFGTALAAGTATWDNAIVGSKLPTSLAGVQVSVGAIPNSTPSGAGTTAQAYLAYVSPTQINALLPQSFSLRNDSSTVVTITHDGLTAWGVITIAPNAPGWFTYPIGLQSFVAAVFANETTLVAPAGAIAGAASRPAKAGDIIALYATGLSALPNCPDGVLLTQVCLISGTQPTVTLGGVAATVLFAGMTSPGLFQINVQVPSGVPTGTQAVVLNASGSTTQAKAVLSFQ
jgi:uncharacterized protein (TIGR03437 family)